jgi:hypothetical protein
LELVQSMGRVWGEEEIKGAIHGARALGVRLELVCIKGRAWEREIEGAMRAPVRL